MKSLCFWACESVLATLLRVQVVIGHAASPRVLYGPKRLLHAEYKRGRSIVANGVAGNIYEGSYSAGMSRGRQEGRVCKPQ